MLVFNTLFKHIKLISLHLKGFLIKLKNAVLHFVTAFLRFIRFAAAVFTIFARNFLKESADFIVPKLKVFSYMSFKISFLVAAALLFTVLVKTYFFQKIMASEMLKIIGDDVTVARVDLGLSSFSHDSVTIRGLSHSSGHYGLKVNEIDVTYDFIESMKERAKIQILNFKNPELNISDIKKLLGEIFLKNPAAVKNYDFLLKMPKISVSGGNLSIAGWDCFIRNLSCEITPLTDYIIFIKSRAELKNSDCRMELSVTLNFENSTIKYSGKISSMGLDKAERFVKAVFHDSVVKNIAGEADVEFNGSYSYYDCKGLSDFKLKPRGCEFFVAAKSEKKVGLKNAELKFLVRTDGFDISDYEISIKNALLAYDGKDVKLEGFFNRNESEFDASASGIRFSDLEDIEGFLPDKNLKKSDLKFGFKYKYKNGRQKAEISVEPGKLMSVENSFELELVSGTAIYEKAGGPGRAEFDFGLSANKGRIYKIKASTADFSVFKYELENIASGRLEIKNNPGALNFTLETPERQAGAVKTSLALNVDLATYKFDAIFSALASEDISALIRFCAPGCGAKLFGGRLYDLSVSGYAGPDKIISHYKFYNSAIKTVPGRGKPVKSADPILLAGIFTLFNSKPGVSFNLKAAGNIGNSIDVSELNNFKFYQLIQKKLFNQNMLLNLSAVNGKLASFKAETPVLAIEYNFDNRINIECKYDNFLGAKGIYFISEKRLKASAKIFGDKLPQAFNGAAKYFALSEFNVDYSDGLLRISSSESKKESALYFELKTSGFHSLMNSRVSLNNVIVETADFSYNGSAQIDFNALNYILKGRLVINNLFRDHAALKMAFSDYSISAAGSFRDMKGGEKPEIRIDVRSAPFLALAQLASSFKIIFSDRMEAVFEDVKIIDFSSNELMSASIEMKRDQALKQNYYYVSYKCSKLKEAFTLLKKSMAGEYKNLVASWIPVKAADLERYAALIDDQVVKFVASGNFILRESAMSGHEFEIAAELKNKVNFLASFSADEKNTGFYKTKLMNYGFAGVTYKGECSIDFNDSRASASFYNDRFTLAQALEIISGEKNDIVGNVSADSKLIYEKGTIKLESKCKVSGAKIDVEKLGKILLKDNKKTGGEAIGLNVEISFGESNYIFNNSIYAMVEGIVSVKGTPASPVVSGNIDVVRGKINYLNRSFDINSGGFKLSTLKNVIKPVEKKSFGPFEAAAAAPKKSVSAGEREGVKYSFRLSPEGLGDQGPAKKTAVELNANISASTRVDDYDIYLTISAGINRLNAYLTSKPELSSESIHMLLYGVKPDAASAFGGGELITSDKFMDVINSQLQDAIYQKLSDSLEKKLNLDEVRINTYTANNFTSLGGRINGKNSSEPDNLKNINQFTDVEVKIGKYVDPALFLSYSKNLYSAKSDSLGMEYKVRKKLFVDGKVNQNLEYRLGAKYGIPF